MSKEVLSYIPALDGLRAFAVVLVIGYHVRGSLDIHAQDALEQGWLWAWFNSGFIGVDLFFVLSGFLITAILLKIAQRQGSMRAFWMRRILRLMPLHFFYILTLFILSLTQYPWGDPGAFSMSLLQWGAMLLYMGNMVLVLYGPFPLELALLWSLALEEQFYMLWPWLIKRIPFEELIRVMVSLGVMAIVLRLALAYMAPLDGAGRYILFTRIDALMCGALIAWSQASGWQGWAKWRHRLSRAWPLALGILLLILRQSWRPNVLPMWLEELNMTIIAICWAIMLLRVLEEGPLVRALLTTRPVRYLGRISYGMYIWHMIATTCSITWLGATATSAQPLKLSVLALTLVLTTLLATFSYYVLERPFLRLKDRFAYFQ